MLFPFCALFLLLRMRVDCCSLLFHLALSVYVGGSSCCFCCRWLLRSAFRRRWRRRRGRLLHLGIARNGKEQQHWRQQLLSLRSSSGNIAVFLTLFSLFSYLNFISLDWRRQETRLAARLLSLLSPLSLSHSLSIMSKDAHALCIVLHNCKCKTASLSYSHTRSLSLSRQLGLDLSNVPHKRPQRKSIMNGLCAVAADATLLLVLKDCCSTVRSASFPGKEQQEQQLLDMWKESGVFTYCTWERVLQQIM